MFRLLVSSFALAVVLISTNCVRADTLAERVAAARELARAGRLEEALALSRGALADAEALFGPETASTALVLFDVSTYLMRLGRVADALPLIRRCAGITRVAFGENSLEHATVLRDLATAQKHLGQYGAALDTYQAAHAAFAAAEGGSGPGTASTANSLALLLLEFSRLSEAERHLNEAGRIYRQQPAGGAEYLTVRLNLVDVYLAQGRVSDASTLASATLAEAEALAGTEGDLYRWARFAQTKVMVREGRLQEAERELNRLLADLRADGRSGSSLPADVLYYQGYIYLLRGLYVEAEPVLRRVIDLFSSLYGKEHVVVGRALHNLALVHQALGNTDQAHGFFARAIAIFATTFGERSPQVATTEIEAAHVDLARGDYGAAGRRAERAIEIFRSVDEPDERLIGLAHVARALSLRGRGDDEGAIGAFEVARNLLERSLGDLRSDLYVALAELGALYTAGGRLAEAEDALARLIEILERDRAVTPRKLPRAYKLMADLRVAQGRLGEGLALIRKSTDILLARASLTGQGYSELGELEQRTARALYAAHVELAHAAAAASQWDRQALAAEAFTAAQAGQVSTAGRAVRQMAVRFAEEAGPLADLVRARQDAIERWRSFDRLRNELLAKPPEQIEEGALTDVEERLAALERDLAAFDERLAREFPSYSRLTNPLPTAVDAIRSILGRDEALVLQMTEDEATYLWLIGSDIVEMVRTELGQSELDRLVRAIRATVDLGDLSGIPPFDVTAAFELYRMTFGAFGERLDRFRHLIFVPDGAMQSLPPGLLLERPVERTAAGDLSAYRAFPWFGRRFAVSVLPTVSSLYALRTIGAQPKSRKPFAGFGDPALGEGMGRARSPEASSVFPGGTQVDRGIFRLLAPLPETAEELERMRRALGGRPEDLYLGAFASERRVRTAPLSDFRTLAFATHAVIAGEFRGLAEPALVLTPPAEARPDEDGLLTASEIARLRLDADWVILSACNTAAPDGTPGADGLSGLAQAFFYAGARTLLVSHWAVASEPTVLLTTGTVERLAKNPDLPKAEALRRSILSLMTEHPDETLAHPAFWAPFVVVGDGWSGMS